MFKETDGVKSNCN